MSRFVGSYIYRSFALVLLASVLVMASSTANTAQADDPGFLSSLVTSVTTTLTGGSTGVASTGTGGTQGPSDSSTGGVWDTITGSAGDALGGIFGSIFGPIAQTGDAAGSSSIGILDAIGNALNTNNLGSLVSGGIMGAITGTYEVPLDFGASGSGGLIYDDNTGNYSLRVPDGNGGSMVVNSINDAVSLGLDLGQYGSIMANGSGAIINVGGLFTINIGNFMSGMFGSGGYCGQASGSGLGQVLCNATNATAGLPHVLGVFAYISAMIMAVMGTLKLVEHVNDPRSVPIWEPLKRYVVGGALFSLPFLTEVFANIVGLGIGTTSTTGMAGQISGGGLDAMLVRLMSDIWSPMLHAITWFAYVAGFFFMMIGVHRLLKSSQDGPRGPAGIGTIMTFIVAGALFSVDSMLAAFSGSMFNAVAGGANVHTYGVLAQTTGDAAVDQHVAATIGVGVAFMVIVGWISFVRGFFIIRGVAEGDQQASLMAGVTHLLGGALAVNIGPVIEAVQSTLGLSSFGLSFT